MSGVKKDVASLRQTDAQRCKRQADVDRKLVEQTKLLREQSQKLLDQERRITALTSSHAQAQQQLVELSGELSSLRHELKQQQQLPCSSPTSRDANTSADAPCSAVKQNKRSPKKSRFQANTREDVSFSSLVSAPQLC